MTEWEYVGAGEKDLYECSLGCGAMRIPGVFEDRHRKTCEHYIEYEICSGCKQEIYPGLCWCGEEDKYHNFSEHSFCPMGCICGYDDGSEDELLAVS